MGNGFQSLAFLRGGEDTLAQRRAIQLAIGQQNPRSKVCGDPGETFAARRDHVAGRQVGVGHGDAQCLEAAAELALAGGDAAGQADDVAAHRPALSAGRRSPCRR